MDGNELELEIDEHAHVFDDGHSRQELQRQMSQLSPRRASVTDESFATTTLPFYQDISPSTALEHMFDWFQPGSAPPVASGPSTTTPPQPPAPDTIGLDDFNRLRRSLGKPVISERNWKRALEELADRREDGRVDKKNFKALFGPDPFFGSESVQGIVREVMKCEETLHFAQMLVSRFGVDATGDAAMAVRATVAPLAPQKLIGLEQLQDIQRACCVDIPVFGDLEWTELAKKLQLEEPPKFLNWMQFTEVFTVTLKQAKELLSISSKSKRVFSPHTDPASVVYAVLANDNVLATVKDREEDNISRRAFTNLLRVKSEKVDDEVWLDLLQNMKTTYNYRERKMTRRNSAAEVDGSDAMHGHEQPLVIVRNTENQVLSYDIVFSELGDIGLTLQSDFYGHCLTVASKDGPAALHAIIEKDDIVAAVNDVSLINDLPAPNKAEEETRLARGKALLDENKIRKVTFYRQESYFRFDPSSKSMTLFLKTIAQVPPDGILVVKCPHGWKPTDESSINLQLRFEIPQLSDFANATATWDAASDSIRVAFDGETAIGENSTLVFHILGMDCGNDIVFGPSELSEGALQVSEEESEHVCFVSLYTNWRYRESSMRGNPIRDQSEDESEFFDKSLQPLGKDFHAGDSGITLGTDFFGQCPVVTTVKKLSAASELDVRPQDILCSIISVGKEGESTSLNQLTCIKPFALSKSEAEKHLKEVRKQLIACHKSGKRYQLQFLRLNSFFFHEDGRTIFTFNALTTLEKGTSIVVKMPSAKWFVSDTMTARVLDPVSAKVVETFWDSQLHSIRLKLDQCMIAESSPVTIEIVGITFTAKKGGKVFSSGTKLAGPGEVVSLKHGFFSRPPELAFELHEHWHSFLVGHQGIEVNKVMDTLKRFKTSPALLWEVLEYTSHLFEMMKASDSETLSLEDLNRLIRIVCGDKHTMNKSAWNELCLNLGAKPLVGLSRRQFACCWNDIVGLSNHQAKDVYMHLDTAKKLFGEIVAIFQNGEDRDVITHETIQRLAKVARFSEMMVEEANKQLEEQGIAGWDCDFFSQIICGGNPNVRFADNGSTLWVEITYAKKLFAPFSVKGGMKKKNLSDLLAAAKILKPKLTNDRWSEICESVDVDDNGSLRVAHFIEVYAGDLLGSRSSLADFYRIETFKLLPERRVKETEVSKEAVMSVAPEKVNVKDVAAKALEETASAEELFQELRAQKLEFSKLDEVKEETVTDFKFKSKFRAKYLSRERGFLHIQVRSITELADRLIHKSSSFNEDKSQAEELYVMFQVTDSDGLQFKIPRQKKKGLCDKVKEQLLGDQSLDPVHRVDPEEKWHGGTQKMMRELHALDVELAAAKPQTPEYDEILRKIKKGEESIRPGGMLGDTAFDGRVFSSLILRDPSPDALIRFPDDEFRVFVDYPDLDRKPKFVVCRLFKRIGSAKSRLQLNLGFEQEALRKAEMTNAILKDLVEQQERLLRLVVAEVHASGKSAVGDNRIWTAVSKLKQKRQDLTEFELEANRLKESVKKIETELDEILKKEKAQAAANPDAAATPSEEGKVVVDDAAAAATPGATDAKDKKAKVASPTAPAKAAPEVEEIRLIGQAFFELRDLLNVLHDDAEETEDLSTFVTETHQDVGVLLLHFQYKCESIQSEAKPMKLPSLTIRMAENDSDTIAKSEEAFEYPSHSHLQLKWSTAALKRGDRFCVVREGDPYKLAMPYFLLMWNKVAGESSASPTPINADAGVDVPPMDEETRMYDWWIPDMLKKFYGTPRDSIVSTDATKQSGKVLFPSALDLSLPPGVYRVYLVRNDTDTRTRVTLGRTPPLAVLPGVNSVHTSFGTTPLIDVKPTSISMIVFPQADRAEMMEALKSSDGFYDPVYELRFGLEQELEMTKRDLAIKETLLGKSKVKKEDKKLEIEELKRIVESLEAQSRRLAEEEKVNGQVSQAVSVRNQPVITSSDPVVFSFRFHGGAPRAEDRIVVLPAEIVRVSDLLRSTILGKLQSNDPEKVKAARRILERELVEVAEIFNMSMSPAALCRLAVRKFKQVFGINGEAGLQDKSEAYKAATGSGDGGEFVKEECMKQYLAAPPLARKYFPLIIRDLLEEVEARTAQLGKSDNGEEPKRLQASRLSKAGALMRVGLELPVDMRLYSELDSDVPIEQSKVLGRAFFGGGMYVAKYVRRVSDEDWKRLSKPGETAGELCRYGPFYVEPASFHVSFWQVVWFLSKAMKKVVQSDQGKLAIKFSGHGILALFKYFLAVISLSFNLSVLAGEFDLNSWEVDELMADFRAKMSSFFWKVEWLLGTIYTFFSDFLMELTENLQFFDAAGECFSGFFLYAILTFLVSATFIVFVVVQEDLLLKVQKLDMYLPFHPGKSALSMLEHVGALLVIPLYLVIKSCVLFISRHWRMFYNRLNLGIPESFETFNLYTEATPTCPDVILARVNYGFGVAAVVLITIFLFVCLPLLLLDLYSWVPLTELEDEKKLHQLAHSMKSDDIRAAVHSNADLVEGREMCCPKRCLKPGLFQRCYKAYTKKSFRDLVKAYGLIRLFGMFIYIYLVLMAKSIGRAFGALLGWRARGGYMYRSAAMKPGSKWRFLDAFCLRFNVTWKIQYIKRKIIMPFVNIVMVTFGLWGEMQWKEFNVEERANDCYKMEPSGEIKQLQMMTLHGKIVSLFWLCVPDTLVLAYLSEVLNRGPIFSYFLNKKFLQADMPESEREKDPVWRFHSLLRFSGEEDVVYLSNTRFYSTVFKWGSSMVEIISLLAVYGSSNKSFLLGMALISSVVAPVLELNQQIIKAYVDYVETVENLAKSTGLPSAYKKATEAYKGAQETKGEMPGVTINTGAIARKRAARKKRMAAMSGNGAVPGDIAGDTAGNTAGDKTLMMLGPSVQLGKAGGVTEKIKDDLKEKTDAKAKEMVDNDVVAAVAMEAVQALIPKKSLIVLNALPQVTYVVLTDALDVGEGEITVSWNVNARQRFHALDAIGMFPARAPGDFSIRTMDKCICYRLLKDLNAEPFGWKARKQDDEEFDRQLIVSRAESLRNFSERKATEITRDSMRSMLSRNNNADEDEESEEKVAAARQQHEEHLQKANATITGMLESPKLKPYKKKMREILADEVAEHGLQKSLPRSVQLMSNGGNALEEAAKKARKVVNGQVKFRPANNSVSMDHPLFESFVYGNDAGIYQPKYGLHSYEFCYLRHSDTEAKVTGLGGGKAEAKPNAKVIPTGKEESDKRYDILDRFTSNEIKIGTFDLFMNLTCDVPLLGPGEKLNLSWIIYGVDYSILSNPKCRNCIAFYRIEGDAGLEKDKPRASKVLAASPEMDDLSSTDDEVVADPVPLEVHASSAPKQAAPVAVPGGKSNPKKSFWSWGSTSKSADAMVLPVPDATDSKVPKASKRPALSSGCAKIEAIPTSAYLEVEENEPCPGRMVVTAPSEPGMYEVRFLFNFFKKAQLHRQCQVFGELEDEMQELRIRSFYEKRAVTEELRKFALRESKRWGIARMNTFAWLKSMLLSTLREPVSDELKESTTEYSEFLFGRLKRKLQRGLQAPSEVFQKRLELMVAPLQRNAFMEVLQIALSSSAQATDQLASVTFTPPTEEDEKNAGLNKYHDMTLLPTDRKVLIAGDVGFRSLALNYLRQESLCGFHDFVDDIVLTHTQLLKTVDQLMKDLSSSCVSLYESAIKRAIAAMMAEADAKGLKNVLQGIDVLLEDLCRNHMQSIVRSFLETDCKSGRRWKGPPKGTLERLNALRSSTAVPSGDDDGHIDLTSDIGNQAAGRALVPPPRDSLTPVTRQHIAVRRWIFPRLTRQLMGNFRQRYARMISGNLPMMVDMARSVMSCIHPGSMSLVGNPFPNHRAGGTLSPLYFMGEARDNRPAGELKDPEDEIDEKQFNEQGWDRADALDDSEANASAGADGIDDDNQNDE